MTIKKVLWILVQGLLWCNTSFAETEQSIRDKYKSTLPDCDNGIVVDFGDTKRWLQWNNCFGRIKFEAGDEGSFIIAADHRDDNTGVEIWTLLPDSKVLPGEILFKKLTKNGCKKNGHSIGADGKLYKIKWNKRCDNVIKRTEIK
jgi:hypothetical protein